MQLLEIKVFKCVCIELQKIQILLNIEEICLIFWNKSMSFNITQRDLVRQLFMKLHVRKIVFIRLDICANKY